VRPNALADQLAAADRHVASDRLAEAKAIYLQILERNPASPDVMTRLGWLLIRSREAEEAIRWYRAAIQLAPREGIIRNGLACALCLVNRRDEAVAEFAVAVEMGFPQARGNLATNLMLLGRYTEALVQFDIVLLTEPDNAVLLLQRVRPLLYFRRYRDAIASLDRAIAIRPGHADLYFQKSEVLLILGDYQSGWRLYENRWHLADLHAARQVFDEPAWDGQQDLADKTIVVCGEQGFGDTIQFIRFIPWLAARARRVILFIHRELGPLAMKAAENVTVAVEKPPSGSFDCHFTIMSLALAIGLQPHDVPFATSYIRADPGRRAQWASRLGPKRRPRVGVVWRGALRGGLLDLRSMAFADILPLFAAAADFYSLQKHDGFTGTEIGEADDRMTDLGDSLADMADTAAVIAEIDLVITIDTAVAHLAGAMGRPVWVMLWNQPDWRWGDGEATPWYPTARLFRQTEEVEWTATVQAVKSALDEWLLSGGGP
jgi:tetratricopeptide (TPR) repeat protein